MVIGTWLNEKLLVNEHIDGDDEEFFHRPGKQYLAGHRFCNNTLKTLNLTFIICKDTFSQWNT